jgi:hypothetical protein
VNRSAVSSTPPGGHRFVSALGQKQTCAVQNTMSATCQKRTQRLVPSEIRLTQYRSFSPTVFGLLNHDGVMF